MKKLLSVAVATACWAVAVGGPVAGGVEPSRVAALRSTAGSAVFGDHPRIWLDDATLASLRAKAAADNPHWKRVRARCGQFLGGRVSWPDGNDYPDNGSIGEGYQGDGYLSPLLELGLCYQTSRVDAPRRAARYARKASVLLERMSAPPGDDHAVDPLRDSGYGIRFFGVGLAIGYDWFYDALSSDLRNRIVAAVDRWIARFESDGFENDFPLGNYFAGYYAAKGMAAIAFEGGAGDGHWDDFIERVHGEMVQPYFEANLSGGGWPEGWNYGPLATLNMSWTALAVKTGAGLDLTTGAAPFTFPLNAPRMLMHSTWPDRLSLEDSNAVYDGDNPTPTARWLFTAEAGLADRFGAPDATTFHAFAAAVRKVSSVGSDGADLQRWVDFLFWPGSPQGAFSDAPLSYAANGPEVGLVRSSWDTDAVWASFKGGPYTACPCSGEEYFDKGALAIVDGSRPFLVNTPGALLRHTPGTSDGAPFFTPIFEALFDTGKRDFFNVFYVDAPSPIGQGELLRSEGVQTSLSAFDEAGEYVYMQATNLEDEYPQHPQNNEATISSWTRDVLYIRPDLFLVDDATSITDAGIDSWMAFHFTGKPKAEGTSRWAIGGDASYRGTVESIFPTGATGEVVNVFDSDKVYRLEVRAPGQTQDVRWLTVLQPGVEPAEAFAAEALAPGSGVTSGSASGVVLTQPRGNIVYLKVTSVPAAGLTYSAPGNAINVLTGLQPGAGYSVEIAPGNSPSATVTVTEGGAFVASPAGVLYVP